MFTSLRDRSVIVTGASKGIGRGIARRFGEAGCQVLVVARTVASADAVAQEIVGAGGRAVAFAGDVSQLPDMRAMADKAVAVFGGIDILCANAGIFPASPLESMTEAGLRPRHGHQPQGHVFRGVGVPRGHEAAAPRAHHSHIVDHGTHHGIYRVVALRRE